MTTTYITKQLKDKHSTKGVGMTHPDASESKVTEKGVMIPLGKPVQSSERSSLLYNEFIVYDGADQHQVHAAGRLQVQVLAQVANAHPATARTNMITRRLPRF